MKKNFTKILVIMLLITSFALSGCDNKGVLCAHISDKTKGTNYAVGVVFDKDERMKEKYVDIQIKCATAGAFISIGRENEEKTVVTFDKADEWYNLTVLIARANGVKGETYEKYDNKENVTYLFTSNSDLKLSFRVVAGNVIENDNEQILVSTEKISNILSLDVKKENKS